MNILQDIFTTILNMSITASYVAIGVIFVRLLLKKAPKIFSYILWVPVLFRLVCPFSFVSAFSFLRLVNINAQRGSGMAEFVPQNIGLMQEPAIHSGLDSIDNTVNTALPQAIPAASINPMQIWIGILSLIWITGVLVLLIYSIVSYVKIKRRLQTATLVEGNVFETDAIGTAFVCGFIRPQIYVPVNVGDTDLSYILEHERTHIRRRDYLIKPLAFLALTLHWFNPLMWLSFALMSRDLEMSCDESVLRRLGDGAKGDYSGSLLSLSQRKGLLTVNPLAFGESHVKARIKNVLKYKKPAFWIVTVTVAACIVLTVSLIANPQTDSPERQGHTEIEDQDDYSEAVEAAMESVKPEEVVVDDTGSNEKTALAWMEAWFAMLKALPEENMAHISDGAVDRLKITKVSKEGFPQAFVFSVTFSVRPTYPIASNAFWMAGNTGNSPGRDETWGQMSMLVELRLGDGGRYHFVSKGTGGVGRSEIYDEELKTMILTSADEEQDEQTFPLPNKAAARLVAIFYGSTMQKVEVLPESVAYYTFYYGGDSFSIDGSGTQVCAKIDRQLYLFDLSAEELAEVNQIIKSAKISMESDQDEPWELIGSADVNRDGREEIFYLDESHMESGPSVTLRVFDSSDNEIWSEQAGAPHTGWNSLFLCEQDGKYYLLRYNPGMWQGYCTYTYTLFTLEGGEEHVVRSNTIEFDVNGVNKLDAPKMVTFAEEVNALLGKSTLLLSSESGEYSFGPSSADQFFERYSWLDETPELYADGDDLETRLVKYSEYVVSNRR